MSNEFPPPPPPRHPLSDPSYHGGDGYYDQNSKDKLQAPAVILMIFAGIGIALQLMNLMGSMMGGGFNPEDIMQMQEYQDLFQQFPELEQFIVNMGAVNPMISIFLNMLSLFLLALMGFGAYKMLRLESYGLAMTATILAIVPCLGDCCWCLDIGVGIWALVVLLDDNVKNSFR